MVVWVICIELLVFVVFEEIINKIMILIDKNMIILIICGLNMY